MGSQCTFGGCFISYNCFDVDEFMRRLYYLWHGLFRINPPLPACLKAFSSSLGSYWTFRALGRIKHCLRLKAVC